MAFHYKDNWFFERLTEDGDVRIYHVVTKVSYASKPYVDTEVDIDPASWASIMASVSARGETAESFAEAQKYHQQN